MSPKKVHVTTAFPVKPAHYNHNAYKAVHHDLRAALCLKKQCPEVSNLHSWLLQILKAVHKNSIKVPEMVLSTSPKIPVSSIPTSLVPQWQLFSLTSRNKLLVLLSPNRPQGSCHSSIGFRLLFSSESTFSFWSFTGRRRGGELKQQRADEKAVIFIPSYQYNMVQD